MIPSRFLHQTPVMLWMLFVPALCCGQADGNLPLLDWKPKSRSAAISPLSEASVANKSKLVDCPDFTKGKWKMREPLSFV